MAAPSRAARILIVDDSAVMRALLRSVVSSDQRLEVAGTASDGASALRVMDSMRPDLILLDVEMPVMDGLSTLKQMRASGKRVPVIMCSTLTQRGAKVTIEALASGASDYVAKPSGQSSREAAVQTLAQDLVPKILALTAYATAAQDFGSVHGGGQGLGHGLAQGLAHSPALSPAHASGFPSAPATHGSLFPGFYPSPVPHQRRAGSAPPAVLLIAVSTGGPAALDLLLPELPANFPLPVLIVQHMPELFTRLLAERLNARCQMRVCEAAHGKPIRSGTIYIARGDWHMEVSPPAWPQAQPSVQPTDGRGSASFALPAPTLRLTQEAPENHCRPAADVLFRSAAAVYGSRILAVVLTGMGYDGLIGSRVVREHGGTVLAQDQPTSAVWGMPGAVAQAGLAHRVLPLNVIAPEILRLVVRGQREAFELRESAV